MDTRDNESKNRVVEKGGVINGWRKQIGGRKIAITGD